MSSEKSGIDDTDEQTNTTTTQPQPSTRIVWCKITNHTVQKIEENPLYEDLPDFLNDSLKKVGGNYIEQVELTYANDASAGDDPTHAAFGLWSEYGSFQLWKKELTIDQLTTLKLSDGRGGPKNTSIWKYCAPEDDPQLVDRYSLKLPVLRGRKGSPHPGDVVDSPAGPSQSSINQQKAVLNTQLKLAMDKGKGNSSPGDRQPEGSQVSQSKTNLRFAPGERVLVKRDGVTPFSDSSRMVVQDAFSKDGVLRYNVRDPRTGLGWAALECDMESDPEDSSSGFLSMFKR
jgi:hypothetical protein